MSSVASTYDIAMFSPAENEKVETEGIPQGGLLKRSSKRVEVPGAMVGCARKSLLGIWKPIGVPFNVCDIAMNGLSFRNFGEGFDPGTHLRMTLLLPGQTPITVTGEVVWNRRLPHAKEEGVSVRAHVCGVQFHKYMENAWGVLTELMEATPKPGAASKATNSRADLGLLA